jgi:hypothetical protein
MRHLLTILAALFLCAPASAQTVKALSYGTNGVVVYSSTNTLTFTNAFKFGDDLLLSNNTFHWGTNVIWSPEDNVFSSELRFDSTNIAAATRANLGFATNLNTFWTATNASNARSAIGLGATWLTNTNIANFRAALGLGESNSVIFGSVNAALSLVDLDDKSVALEYDSSADQWWIDDTENFRLRLGLSESDIVTFAGITNNGNVTIANTTATNGILFIRRTNNEAFLGMANLIASNNATISNETLFRVGVAEATNRSAQFGFRTVRTNNGGEGFATFSVFGYNALMMIGPSDRSRTNTATNAGIEADIWTITPTNRVMTLRDTNTGALTMHQDLGFGAGLTNTAPTNTNTPAVWMRVWVGTNSYRVPLYQ